MWTVMIEDRNGRVHKIGAFSEIGAAQMCAARWEIQLGKRNVWILQD